MGVLKERLTGIKKKGEEIMNMKKMKRINWRKERKMEWIKGITVRQSERKRENTGTRKKKRYNEHASNQKGLTDEKKEKWNGRNKGLGNKVKLKEKNRDNKRKERSNERESNRKGLIDENKEMYWMKQKTRRQSEPKRGCSLRKNNERTLGVNQGKRKFGNRISEINTLN